MNSKFGDDFLSTLNNFKNQESLILDKIHDFVSLKTSSPYNGAAPDGTKFGKIDKRFRSGGLFTNKISGISHAHLTHNISIVYRIDSGILYLYGLYTHDDIGTGTPPNVNRQNQMATKWSNTNFKELDSGSLAPKQKKEPEIKSSNNIPQYQPKVKQTQPVLSKLEQLISRADTEWTQRNILEKYRNNKSKEAVYNLIRSEILYLNSLRQSNKKLYPNQIQYYQTLSDIAKELSK